jgi:uncharacterized membrane protein
VADPANQRLDTFVDAAFAFAVTLMVVGGGGFSVDADTLANSVAAIPSFAIGFAIIAMFWHAQVRWRRLRGEGDWRSVLLVLLLTFVVLIYVTPLRAMATSFAAFLGGSGDGFRGSLAMLFTVYGVGFTTMSAVMALLFADALRNPALAPGLRREALGETWIWVILAATGIASTLIALIPSPVQFGAPFLYATLPVTIGLFVWRWGWDD